MYAITEPYVIIDVKCDKYDVPYRSGHVPPHYPVPAIIYAFNEFMDIWEYTGQPDDIKSSYPTYYKLVKLCRT